MTTRLTTLVAAAAGALLMLALPAAAAAKDRNHDRIPDRWEKRHHLTLRVNQARRDQDRDGLGNRGEFLASDKPHDPDTDDDGVKDGDENAGRIASFDSGTGRLVIDLFGGDTLSGQVTDETEIECGDQDTAESENDNQAEDRGDETSTEVGDDDFGDDSGGDAATCTQGDLTPGTVVAEAELRTEGATAVFEEVKLAG